MLPAKWIFDFEGALFLAAKLDILNKIFQR